MPMRVATATMASTSPSWKPAARCSAADALAAGADHRGQHRPPVDDEASRLRQKCIAGVASRSGIRGAVGGKLDRHRRLALRSWPSGEDQERLRRRRTAAPRSRSTENSRRAPAFLQAPAAPPVQRRRRDEDPSWRTPPRRRRHRGRRAQRGAVRARPASPPGRRNGRRCAARR